MLSNRNLIFYIAGALKSFGTQIANLATMKEAQNWRAKT